MQKSFRGLYEVKVFGEANIIHYTSDLFVIAAGILVVAGIFLAIIVMESEFLDSKKRIRLNIICGVLVIVGITIASIDGSIKREFYIENGEQFLKDLGVEVVEREKYPKTDQLTSKVKVKERRMVYNPQKVKSIIIDHVKKSGDKKLPEIEIQLENGSTFVIEDGEKLLKTEDAFEENLYFTIRFKEEDVSVYTFSKSDDKWQVYLHSENDIQIIRGKEELEEITKKLNE